MPIESEASVKKLDKCLSVNVLLKARFYVGIMLYIKPILVSS